MTQFKDKVQHQPHNINLGLLAYPVLQAADILLYGATRVPVGEDQRQHLELAREIVRRFNARFGETFVEPQPLLSTTPKILGLDGQAKMSKSLGNTIALAEPEKAIWDKLRTAATDPARVEADRSGHAREVCNIFTLHKFFSERGAAGRPCTPGAPPQASAASTARRCCSKGSRPSSRRFARGGTPCAPSRRASTRSWRAARRTRARWPPRR